MGESTDGGGRAGTRVGRRRGRAVARAVERRRLDAPGGGPDAALELTGSGYGRAVAGGAAPRTRGSAPRGVGGGRASARLRRWGVSGRLSCTRGRPRGIGAGATRSGATGTRGFDGTAATATRGRRCRGTGVRRSGRGSAGSRIWRGGSAGVRGGRGPLPGDVRPIPRASPRDGRGKQRQLREVRRQAAPQPRRADGAAPREGGALHRVPQGRPGRDQGERAPLTRLLVEGIGARGQVGGRRRRRLGSG